MGGGYDAFASLFGSFPFVRNKNLEMGMSVKVRGCAGGGWGTKRV